MGREHISVKKLPAGAVLFAILELFSDVHLPQYWQMTYEIAFDRNAVFHAAFSWLRTGDSISVIARPPSMGARTIRICRHHRSRRRLACTTMEASDRGRERDRPYGRQSPNDHPDRDPRHQRRSTTYDKPSSQLNPSPRSCHQECTLTQPAVYLATLILGRDASLAVAAIYYRFASLPSPKTFMRYWDFSLPSAEVHPTTVSKYNTFLQLILIGSALALPVLTVSPTGVAQLQTLGLDISTLHAAMTYFQYVVAATTAWSGLSYAYLKNAVTILGTDEALKAKQGRRGRAIIGVTFGSVVLAALYVAATVDEEKKKERLKEDGEGSR
nr:cardiolipin synthase (cmp-forming) [Quercus suber]